MTRDYSTPRGHWLPIGPHPDDLTLELAGLEATMALEDDLTAAGEVPLRPIELKTTTYLAGPNPDGFVVVLAETVALKLTNPPLLERYSLFGGLRRRLGAAATSRPPHRHLGGQA